MLYICELKMKNLSTIAQCILHKQNDVDYFTMDIKSMDIPQASSSADGDVNIGARAAESKSKPKLMKQISTSNFKL